MKNQSYSRLGHGPGMKNDETSSIGLSFPSVRFPASVAPAKFFSFTTVQHALPQDYSSLPVFPFEVSDTPELPSNVKAIGQGHRRMATRVCTAYREISGATCDA